jgi:c-di-GMP-binding flagellar brake protein YcgR
VLPKINQTMYLQLESNDSEAEPATMRSRVADQDEFHIYMEIPLIEKSSKLYRPQPGERFQLYYFTHEGVKHSFATEVTGFRKDTVSLISIRKPSLEEIAKDQRRSFLRVEAQLELAVRIGEKLRFVAITDDVGGGGLSFRCERRWPLESGISLSCYLLLSYRGGSVAHSKFEGEVVRVMPVDPDKTLVMVRFKEIADSEQQKIIRYCFERQLDKRKE